jgi:hypothetical protein
MLMVVSLHRYGLPEWRPRCRGVLPCGKVEGKAPCRNGGDPLAGRRPFGVDALRARAEVSLIGAVRLAQAKHGLMGTPRRPGQGRKLMFGFAEP